MKLFKKLICKITKGKRLEILVYAIFVLVLLCFFSAKELIDLTTFSSVIIAALISSLVMIVGNWLYNIVEDSMKLTQDYDELINRYKMEDMITVKNGEDVIHFPVVKVADLYNKNIYIDDNSESIYELPPLIVENYFTLFRSHKTSEIYNNPNIRVNNWVEQKNGDFIIYTGRTTYFNSLVTNRSMDYVIDKNLSIREIFECGPYLTSLSKSSLSNHLGFNGLVESSDGYFVFIDRGKNVSIGKDTLGTSIGASLKLKYALNKNMMFDSDGLKKSIIYELKDELSIGENEIDNSYKHGVNIISAYRDLVEGGKPQLLFYVRTTKTKEEIEKDFFLQERLNKKSIKSKSFSDNDNVERLMKSNKELKMITDGNKMIWISRAEMLEGKVKIYPDRLICKDKTFTMVPSASASIVMILEWLKKDGFE